jgi:hypothetical protein
MAYFFGYITLPKKERIGTASRASSRVSSRVHSRSTSRSGSRSPIEGEKMQFSEESARALEGDTIAAAAVALEAAFELHDEAVKYIPKEFTTVQTTTSTVPPTHPTTNTAIAAQEPSNSASLSSSSIRCFKIISSFVV